MRDLLNKKNYLSFKQRCRSADISVVHVNRRDSGREVRFQYNAREPRSKRLVTAEWIIPRTDDTEAREKAFLDLLKSDFVVSMHDPAAADDPELTPPKGRTETAKEAAGKGKDTGSKAAGKKKAAGEEPRAKKKASSKRAGKK